MARGILSRPGFGVGLVESGRNFGKTVKVSGCGDSWKYYYL
jgi:hypothetical protein